MQAVAQNKYRASEESTWLSGITEVQLPVEFKMKNIAATEAAKQNLIHAKRMEAKEAAAGGGGAAARAAALGSADAAVMERYKKRAKAAAW